MKIRNALLSIGLLTISTNIFAEFTRPTLDLSMSAFSIKEDALLSRGAATALEAKTIYKIEDGFKINLQPVISFISGQQTSRDPQSPLTNSFYLKEASVEKELWFESILKAGALYQKNYLPAMVGYTKSFPGVSLSIPYLFENQLIHFLGEAAVPTSSGLATTTNELESNATLYVGSIFLKSSWTANLKTELNYSHYKFNNLSTQAGYDSLQRGNTVTKINSSTGYFVYKYGGDELQLVINYLMLDTIDFKVKTSYTKNSLAPSNLNSGYNFSIAPGMRISEKYILRPQIEHYHVEADAMVAVFSDSTFGRSNRDGYRYGFQIENAKYNLQVIYAQSTLVKSNPFQSADTSTFINLDIKNINL